MNTYDWSNEPRYKTLERIQVLYGPDGITEFRAELDRLAKGPPRIGKERAWFAIRSNPRYFPPGGPGHATPTLVSVSAPSENPNANVETDEVEEFLPSALRDAASLVEWWSESGIDLTEEQQVRLIAMVGSLSLAWLQAGMELGRLEEREEANCPATSQASGGGTP